MGVFAAGGCVSRPAGPDTPTMQTIESATHMVDYPSQRLAILRKVAAQPDLQQHEQTYLVDAIFMGGFSSDRANALLTLLDNPCCTPLTRGQIREEMKKTRMLGNSERRVIDALHGKETAEPE